MLIDKGLNDQWVRPQHLKRVGAGRYTLTLQETLGKHWPSEIVSYPLPREARNKPLLVALNGAPVPSQVSGGAVSILVKNLQPHEERVYQVVAAVYDRRSIDAGKSAVIDRRYVRVQPHETNQ
ncbi:MAG: hypothetical protein HY360_24535 [Verrucomicrobia bacterium]|nr:hypothetical protein [Verrucomicrobiota bacterium]